MCYWILTKSGTVIAKKTVKYVTRNDMLDAETTAQVENFNTAINERLYDTFFRIQHGEDEFTLDDEYDLQQWDSYYGEDYPTAEEYGASNEDTPLSDSEDTNDDR